MPQLPSPTPTQGISTVGLPTGPFLNAQAIYRGLLAMGLNSNAAAGVAGNIYQESHGNPGSSSPAGGGLFGLTVANGGSVNGGSLASELAKLHTYINQNGSIADINAHASTPTAAADWFSQHYERPGDPKLPIRESAAQWVAGAAKSGNWGAGVQVNTSSGTSATTTAASGIGIPGLDQITPFFSDATTFVKGLIWLTHPANWVRIVAFLAGVALLLFALHAFIAVGNGEPIIQAPNVIPVPV